MEEANLQFTEQALKAIAHKAHERETGAATLEDELKALEQELQGTQTRLAAVRRRWKAAGRTGLTECGTPVTERFLTPREST